MRTSTGRVHDRPTAVREESGAVPTLRTGHGAQGKHMGGRPAAAGDRAEGEAAEVTGP
jgi:hypothetical protein